MDWTADRCVIENDLTLKITMAAVIYIIKYKPAEFATSRDFAIHIQNTFLASKKHQKFVFEKEKECLVSDLSRISEVDATKLSLATQAENNQNDEALLNDKHNNEHSHSDAANLKSTTEFIEALIHIINATNSKNSIYSGNFQVFLSRISQNLTHNTDSSKTKCKEEFVNTRTNTLCSKIADPVDCFQSLFAKFSLKSPDMYEESSSKETQAPQQTQTSQDSGYSSLDSLEQPPPQSYVLSSDVNQALRKNKVDLLLAKSVQTVLQSLKSIIYTEASKDNFWRSGSVIETSMNSIVSLVNCITKYNEKNDCRDLCLAFVKSLIEEIPTGDKNSCNLRCKVIRELSASPFICSDGITYVLHQMSKLKENTSVNISRVGEDHFNMCGLDMIEEDSFIVLYKVLKEMLMVYTRNNKKMQHSSTSKSKPFSICAVWKRSTEHEAARLEEQKMVLQWRTRLEEMNEVLSVHFSHLLFFNYECLRILEENKPLTDALGSG